jgi:hypothetical protein
MKLSKKKLIHLIEHAALESLLGEDLGKAGATVYSGADPVDELFNSAFDAVEALGAMIPANNPAYVLVEDALMRIMDAREQYTGDN